MTLFFDISYHSVLYSYDCKLYAPSLYIFLVYIVDNILLIVSMCVTGMKSISATVRKSLLGHKGHAWLV